MRGQGGEERRLKGEEVGEEVVEKKDRIRRGRREEEDRGREKMGKKEEGERDREIERECVCVSK